MGRFLFATSSGFWLTVDGAPSVMEARKFVAAHPNRTVRSCRYRRELADGEPARATVVVYPSARESDS